MIKVICCDIDGTLVRDDKSLSEENRFWIKKAVEEKGVKFVIASGRIPSSLRKYNRMLGIRGLTSSINGTYLIDADEKPLKSHVCSPEVSDAIISAREKLGASMLCACGNKWFTEDHETFVYKQKRELYAQESLIGNPREVAKTYGVNKFLFMSPEPEMIHKIRTEIECNLNNPYDVSFYPGTNFLEVMPGGINKGTSVNDLIGYYNLDKSEVMALGDDINDIEMLQNAGIGIAMGNALDCVKSVAYDITETNENDGVAKAIRKYVFR